MKRLPLFLIKVYRQLSFLFPSCCKYYPSCSEYAKQAFLKYSFWKASGLTFFRVLRCNPFVKGGIDLLR